MNESDIKKYLGLRLKQLRKKKTLTQFQLGELIDIDQRQVAYIEGGNCFPSLTTLKKYTDVFECEIKDLFNFDSFNSVPDVRKKLITKISETDNNTLSKIYSILEIIDNVLL